MLAIVRYCEHLNEVNMTKSETQVNFRMPENILVRFKAEIQKERRSQTAQLILLVEEWLEKREKQQDAKA